MVVNRRKVHHGIQIIFKKNKEIVGSLQMAGVDQRFIDEDDIVNNAMKYIAMRHEYGRRIDDSSIPDWDSADIVVNPHLTIPIGKFGRIAN